MKKIILSAAFVAFIGGVSTVKASSISTPVNITQTDSTKTPVKLEELPAPVTTTLKSDAVKEWTPTEAFLIKNETTEYYLINVQKGTEVRFIKLDKEGKPVK